MCDDERIISVRFNQNIGCFTCCMESGIRIYNIEPLVEKTHYDIEVVGSVSHCEMLFRTNLLAIVSGGSNPKYPENVLMIYDDLLNKFILNIAFPSSVKAVRLRRDKLIVALMNQVHVFSFPTPTQRLFTLETAENPRGLVEVSSMSSAEKQKLIFPGYKTGSVQIVDLSCTEIGMSNAAVWVAAHRSKLACLALNQLGTLMATASKQGTLIRVWDTTSRNQLFELRRGSDPANINCINFSTVPEFLCCSSDKGTVHIFAIKNLDLNRKMIPSGGILGKYGESMWGLANFTVPPESSCICAFGPDNSVIAVCEDGTMHKYSFTEEGTCYRKSFDCFLDVSADDDL